MQNTPVKFNLKWDVPFKILEQKSNVTYKIKLVSDKNKNLITHVDRLKLFSTSNKKSQPNHQSSQPNNHKQLAEFPKKLIKTSKRIVNQPRKRFSFKTLRKNHDIHYEGK